MQDQKLSIFRVFNDLLDEAVGAEVGSTIAQTVSVVLTSTTVTRHYVK